MWHSFITQFHGTNYSLNPTWVAGLRCNLLGLSGGLSKATLTTNCRAALLRTGTLSYKYNSAYYLIKLLLPDIEMRRHTAKGVVSSVTLAQGEEFLTDDLCRSQKESQSKQRKRKAEENTSSDEPITDVKKRKDLRHKTT